MTLKGRFGSVERLDRGRHGATLWEAMRGHDEIWTYNVETARSRRPPRFAAWLAERATLDDPYYFSIVEPPGRAVGI